MAKLELSGIYNRSFKVHLLIATILLLIPVVAPSSYIVGTLNLVGLGVLVCTGLTMLMGLAGQISLGHSAFYGIGAYVSAFLSVKAGLSPWLGIVAGAAAAGLVALIVGIPALKLREHYLALATLGFGVIVFIVFKEWKDFTGGLNGFYGIPNLSLFGWSLDTDSKMYYVIWILVALGIIFAKNVVHSRVGRALRSIHGSETASDAMGVNTHKYKVQVFAVSAMYASVAGSLYAHYITFISPQLFDVMTSINFLIMVIIGGAGLIEGALIGAALFTLLGEVLKEVVSLFLPNTGGEFEIVFFGALLVILLIYMPEGLVPGLQAAGRKLLNRRKEKEGFSSPSSVVRNFQPRTARKQQQTSQNILLQVRSLTKSFGGVTAVHDVTFDVIRGEIVAVIGPNGAGKTTLFNMITAVLQPTSGQILFENRDITDLKPYKIAKLGVTRTFQNLQVFNNMSVVENVMIGLHCRMHTGLFRAGLRWRSVHKEEAYTLQTAMKYLEEVGLAHRAYESAATLPYGSQRLLEIARAAISQPKLILLDEPMAGLNPQESRELVEIILKMREEGVTFLFVEHDMDTVMSIADKLIVLDYGEMIAEGTSEEISSNPQVIAAYLGEEGDVV